MEATKRSKAKQQSRKEVFDAKRVQSSFELNDLVLVRIPSNHPSVTKFTPIWDGPYRIESRVGPETYRVTRVDHGRTRNSCLPSRNTVHSSRLKRFVKRESNDSCAGSRYENVIIESEEGEHESTNHDKAIFESEKDATRTKAFEKAVEGAYESVNYVNSDIYIDTRIVDRKVNLTRHHRSEKQRITKCNKAQASHEEDGKLGQFRQHERNASFTSDDPPKWVRDCQPRQDTQERDLLAGTMDGCLRMVVVRVWGQRSRYKNTLQSNRGAQDRRRLQLDRVCTRSRQVFQPSSPGNGGSFPSGSRFSRRTC